MEMVDGHPILVQIAFYHLSRGEMTLEHLLKTSATNVGIYTHHLQRHRVVLQEQPELANALNTVISATEPAKLDRILTYKLNSMGLIKRYGDQVILGCELYRQCFAERFNHR
jgi:hypothetical protein